MIKIKDKHGKLVGYGKEEFFEMLEDRESGRGKKMSKKAIANLEKIKKTFKKVKL